MTNANESNEIRGRLKRRERHVQHAVVFASNASCLAEVGGTPRIVGLLVQLERCGIEHVTIVGAADAARNAVKDRSQIPAVSVLETDGKGTAAELARAMAHLEAERGEQPLLLIDADVSVDDEQLLADLVSDPRPNVLAVELKLAHRLTSADLKVQMEPVDVPWFTRRVVGVGQGLQPEFCHGLPVGIQVIGSGSFADLLGALESRDAIVRYEEVFESLLADGHEFYTVAVQPRSGYRLSASG